MTRINIVFLMAALVALSAVSACAGAKAVTQADLVHHRFVLASVDGVAFSGSERVPDIEFNEGFRVSGSICNRFMGQGELSGNTLTVRQMASTKMLCVDPALNELEGKISGMLMDGVDIELSGNTLTLRQGGRVLVYTAGDWVR